LIDCLEANKTRTATKKARKVRKLCSTEEHIPDRWQNISLAEDEKIEYCFGLPPETLKKQLPDFSVFLSEGPTTRGNGMRPVKVFEI
jgi:hypothetical protein